MVFRFLNFSDFVSFAITDWACFTTFFISSSSDTSVNVRCIIDYPFVIFECVLYKIALHRSAFQKLCRINSPTSLKKTLLL